MIKINVLESFMVQPATDTPRQKLWLTDVDLLMSEIHTPTTHFFHCSVDIPSDFFNTNRLRDSLSKALVTFYPAAGRFARDKNDRLEINCNGEGALLLVAEAEVTIDEFGDFAPSKKLMQLVPKADLTKGISFYPLFLAQVTHFKCGAVCMGIAFHHILADGPSVMHMINSWAELSRGIGITLQPYINRTALRARVPPTPSFPHTEFHPPPVAIDGGKQQVHLSQSSPPVTEFLDISHEQLSLLKASAHGYTTFEVIAAHAWRCACKARCIPDNQVSNVHITVDSRARFQPPLPPGYFGSPQFTALPSATAGDLIRRPLEYTAGLIHTAIARMDDEYLKSAVDYLALQPDLKALKRGPHLYLGANLKVTSWIGLPVYETDFGWGQPFFMGRATVPSEGQVYVLPSPKKDGSFVLSVTLQANHMASFKKENDLHIPYSSRL